MTEREANKPFETRFAERARAYTDPATARRSTRSRSRATAMSSARATGWSRRRPGTGLLGRRIATRAGRRPPWPSSSSASSVSRTWVPAVGLRHRAAADPRRPRRHPAPRHRPRADPRVLRHSWQRPLPSPQDRPWPTAFLMLTDEILGVGPERRLSLAIQPPRPPDLRRSWSPLPARRWDARWATFGVYRFAMEGKDTFRDPDAGRHGRMRDPGSGAGRPLGASGHCPRPMTASCCRPGRSRPRGSIPSPTDATPGRLSYTVPTGWKVKEDASTSFVLHHLPTVQVEPATDTFIFMIAQPRLAAAFEDWRGLWRVPRCASGVGSGADDIVGALRARPGVIASPPTAVTMGGYEGTLIDLRSCTDGPEAVRRRTDRASGSRSSADRSRGGRLGRPGADAPVRLILVDVGDGRTMATVVACAEPSTLAFFDAQVATAMPVIESSSSTRRRRRSEGGSGRSSGLRASAILGDAPT